MIAAWMTYALVSGTVIALAAWLLDHAMRLARLPARWMWAGALAVTVAAVALAPQRAVATHWRISIDPAQVVGDASAAATTRERWLPAVLRRMSRDVAAPVERAVRVTRRLVPTSLDRWLGAAWIALSAAALLLFGAVLARFRRARSAWPIAELQGDVVRVAPDGGPAVIGLARPEIVVPRWLLGCSAEEQRLVLDHEREHVRARDHLLLAAGCFSLALIPWHPAVWWMLSRLRLAVELDCDRRVLERGATPHSYGSLLIDLAGRCTGLPLGAPALADEFSHLERRLLAMKPTTVRFAPLRGAALAVVALAGIVAACEARLPTAPEVEKMDVSQAESRARQALLLDGDSGNVLYMVDGVVSPAKTARELTPEQIAAIEVERGVSEAGADARSMVSITTREFVSRNGMPGDTTRDHLRLRLPGPTTEVELRGDSSRATLAVRRFEGLVVVDGVIVTEDAMAKIDPRRILRLEVVKGDAAARLYPASPEAKKGVIRITTKK